MKIIDIINKINNNEEIPKKIKYEDIIFEYDKDRKEYIHKLDDWCSETILFKAMNENTYFIQELLKIEVEVIEENKEIEELDNMELINARPEVNATKINELVRAVNKLNKDLNEIEREDK